MNKTLKRIAENFLFAANIFILFLLLFENKMVFPAWLQSIGRMHPMFLHFPIVILLIAMCMEFFRHKSNYASQDLYQNFTTVFLLTGSISAAITVIMGLLLSKENGYDADTVAIHKWFGIGIVFIGSFIYRVRNKNFYTPILAKIFSIAAVVCIIIGGHLGADITHGENFVSTPLLSKKEKVPLEKAIIYKDVVQPILTSKCTSCHNSQKAKGNLLLDNEANILKGGKNGKLFVAANSENSLLIQRINLPDEEKKHMPLSGKPQLSDDEKNLLFRWIQAGADFKKKVIDLPENDSLRIIAAKFLAPPVEEEYTFSPADEKTVHSLSNNYRVVFPLAKESPALVVDFYNKKQFSSKALEELLSVKKQIVELNVNKMPVTDNDLKTIAQFENLRTLNLDFTDITNDGLSNLASLKYLNSLSLSGTKIDNKNISVINKIKTLKEVFVWNTLLKQDDINKLKNENKNINFIEGYKNNGNPIQLNEPILLTTATVFTDTIHLALTHPIPRTQIRYTLDGSNPDSISALYSKDLFLDKTTIFKARAFKETWLPSDSIVYNFYKSSFKPDSVFFDSLPDNAYKADGAKSLFDHLTGSLNFGAGKWMGWQKDMTVFIQFNNAATISSVALHLLKNIGADIYPPTLIQIWGGNDKAHLKLLQSIKPDMPVKGDIPSLFLEDCKFPVTHLRYIKIVAVSVKKVPKFGTSPNKRGWIFADEILLN
jgi:predicted CXXCH cytochrome family protein